MIKFVEESGSIDYCCYAVLGTVQ